MPRWRRRTAVLAGVVLLAVVASATAWYRSGHDDPAQRLTVTWGGSEGHPPCVYDARTQAGVATIVIDGRAPRDETATITVTAYADENTSEPVGSHSRSAHVDEDGGAACRRAVAYAPR